VKATLKQIKYLLSLEFSDYDMLYTFFIPKFFVLPLTDEKTKKGTQDMKVNLFKVQRSCIA
jgi:hypothetical protein